MFDEHDEALTWVRAVCLGYPEASERISHGRPNFFVRRSFCFFGGSERIDGSWVAHDHAVLVKLDPNDAPAYREDPRCFIPAYLGPKGWIGVELDAVDPDEAAELIDASYRATAPARLVRSLDEG